MTVSYKCTLTVVILQLKKCTHVEYVILKGLLCLHMQNPSITVNTTPVLSIHFESRQANQPSVSTGNLASVSRFRSQFSKQKSSKVALVPEKDSSPKNENSVIIYLPSSCSKHVRSSMLCGTYMIFWRMFVTKWLWGIDFHCIFSLYNGSQWCPTTVWLYWHSWKYLLLCSAGKKTFRYLNMASINNILWLWL